MVPDVDEYCRPMEEMHEETTLAGVGRIAEIAGAVHANGGKVIANVNVVLAWLLGNVEPQVDVLSLGYDTYPAAILDVYFGRFAPVGKLPITMPRNDAVIAVDSDGVCISPNDVPGFDKDQYMPDDMKDENGKAYAYRDAVGNYYEMNFGLNY
jgi:beta-glucosidase